MYVAKLRSRTIVVRVAAARVPSSHVLLRRGTVFGCGACDMKASAAIVEPRLLRGWAFDSPPFHACIAHLSDLARLQDLPDRPVWEPTRRIGSARRKLDGSNPVAMLVDDLKQIPAVDKFSTLTALEAILRRGCPRPARAVAARNLLCCSCFGLILHGADFGGKPRRGEEWVRLASNREHTQRTTTHSSAQQCTAHSSTVAFSGYFGAATPARGLVY